MNNTFLVETIGDEGIDEMSRLSNEEIVATLQSLHRSKGADHPDFTYYMAMLVRKNLGMLRRVISHVCNFMLDVMTEEDWDNYLSRGASKLFDCVLGYDPALGNKFITYATKSWRNDMWQEIAHYTNIPNYQNFSSQMDRLKAVLDNNGSHSIAEIAKEARLSEKRVRELLNLLGLLSADSLDTPRGNGSDDRPYAELLEYNVPSVERQVTEAMIIDDFVQFAVRQNEDNILFLELLLEGYELAEIAEICGVTRQALDARLRLLTARYRLLRLPA